MQFSIIRAFPNNVTIVAKFEFFYDLDNGAVKNMAEIQTQNDLRGLSIYELHKLTLTRTFKLLIYYKIIQWRENY